MTVFQCQKLMSNIVFLMAVLQDQNWSNKYLMKGIPNAKTSNKKMLVSLYCDILRSIFRRMINCISKVIQYHLVELAHISQHKINNLSDCEKD